MLDANLKKRLATYLQNNLEQHVLDDDVDVMTA